MHGDCFFKSPICSYDRRSAGQSNGHGGTDSVLQRHCCGNFAFELSVERERFGNQRSNFVDLHHAANHFGGQRRAVQCSREQRQGKRYQHHCDAYGDSREHRHYHHYEFAQWHGADSLLRNVAGHGGHVALHLVGDKWEPSSGPKSRQRFGHHLWYAYDCRHVQLYHSGGRQCGEQSLRRLDHHDQQRYRRHDAPVWARVYRYRRKQLL